MRAVRARTFLTLGVIALAIGAFVLVYRGPGREVIRGHGGDVAATMLVYALLGLAWRARPWVRALATLGVATAIELGQLVWRVNSFAGELVLGTTFDPWDLVAYSLGVAVAVAWEAPAHRIPPRSLASSAERFATGRVVNE
jgi:hypothetical protein